MKKRKYYLPLIVFCLLVIVLVPLLFGCMPPSSSGSSTTTITDRVNAIDARSKTNEETNNKQQGSIDELYDKKLSKSDYEASDSYPKTELYTRSEVETKIANAISALKSDQSWINSSGSSSTTNTGSTTGTVSISTDPSSVQIMGSTVQQCFTVKIVNGMNQWRYVKPIMTLTSTTSTKIYGNKAAGGDGSAPGCLLSYTASGVTITSTTDSTTSNIQFSPDIMTVVLGGLTSNSYASLMTIPISGGNNSLGEFYVGPGQTMTVLCCVALRTETAVVWMVTMSATDRGL